MIRLLIARLRELIWPAIFAVILAPLAILVAIIAPGAIALTFSLGLAAITMAILANRA
jgi:hypothetical protein